MGTVVTELSISGERVCGALAHHTPGCGGVDRAGPVISSLATGIFGAGHVATLKARSGNAFGVKV